MSYARFGWNGSDVYVFLCVSGHFECCWCRLGQWRFDDTDAMIAHLREHVAAGHTVPDETLAELEQEREANDAWIAAGAPRDDRDHLPSQEIIP